MKNKRIDNLLRKALGSTETPEPVLIEKVKYMLAGGESNSKRSTINHSLKRVAAFAVAFVLITTTAFAAWHFLSPSEVADRLESPILAEAFRSKDALLINETKSQKGYDISFLGIVSGKGLTKLDDTLNVEKTYAVVAITKQEGSMPDTSDEDYNSTPFFVSPVIHGQEPWLYNIAGMNGGYSAFVKDGIMYRLIECDSLEMFADRGLSLIVSSTTFYDINAYNYDEATGLVIPNPDYEGINLIFDLPLTKDNADFEKAQQYLDSLWNIGNTNGDAESFGVYEDSEIGLVAKQFVDHEEYQIWMNHKLEETQKSVDKGEYSVESMNLDRLEYESNLEKIKNGAILTLLQFKDGSYSVEITYPEKVSN